MLVAVRFGSVQARVQRQRSVQAQQRDATLPDQAVSLAAAGERQVRKTPSYQSKLQHGGLN